MLRGSNPCGTARLASCLVLSIAATGCGKSGVDIIPVSGTVTLDGKPLSHGMVLFVPDSGRAAKGTIGQDGSFVLGTYSDSDGAAVGDYRIAVIAREEISGQDGGPGPEFLPPGVKTGGGRSLIAPNYTDPATSGLAAKVQADQQNEFRLELFNTPTREKK